MVEITYLVQPTKLILIRYSKECKKILHKDCNKQRVELLVQIREAEQIHNS